ncbi:LuxR C-terminal-related transcriptional regulator [Aureispira anguillae]|uniref:LuxR C-terminal-related transcriptional regulator n=2 Tax=Aureispira anguillae TaxID=2864201 RepID=A0A915Y9W0_9BACT|nr:LuxR C-terminal-related transcriptional regulator [Aureispira anguillae]
MVFDQCNFVYLYNMSDKEYFSNLYEIASDLNKEFSLQAALRKALEKTVDLLNLETGWIWLVQQDNKSVYLAASYNLPPALSNFPERLSGWCYCIEKYLSNAFSEAKNISEIACSRLKDIKVDTRDLKFHATVPIFVQGEKAGLLNLMSKEKQQLKEKELTLLNTISELIGMAIQRTRLLDTAGASPSKTQAATSELLERVFNPRLTLLLANLDALKALHTQAGKSSEYIQMSLELTREMQQQLSLINDAFLEGQIGTKQENNFHYPASSLTSRELEVLGLVKKGYTNKKIGAQLFIAERTVKFHISSILSKLYATTRTEAVDTALRRGLISL